MNTDGAPAAGLRLDDRYRLVKQVGSGGISVVFDAHDEILQRHVAVKMLAPRLSADPELPRRLLLEARAVAVLHHPNITTVFDFGVHRADDGTLIPYLVMETLDGELLSDVLHLGRMPWREAVDICAQLAAALAAAHAAGIVHHDITPANIMLTPTGVKVVDFGICALIGDTQLGDTQLGDTQLGDGENVGTASYLAPERLTRGQVSAGADVYAAGLVLYRCLAGRLPWDAGTVAEMLHAHANVQPRRLPPSSLPQAIEDACYQCLAREPGHRPSAAELTRVLSRRIDRSTTRTIRVGKSPPHPPTDDGQTAILSVVPHGPRRHQRSRRTLTGAAALCSILALGYLLYPTGSSRPRAVWLHAQADTTGAAPCSITYNTKHAKDQQFDVTMTITNTGRNPIKAWTLQFELPGNESIVDSHRAGTMQLADIQQIRALQQGQHVTLIGTSTLAPGIALWLTLTGRDSSRDSSTKPPAGFILNGQRCDATVTLSLDMRIAVQPPDTTMTVAPSPPDRTLPG